MRPDLDGTPHDHPSRDAQGAIASASAIRGRSGEVPDCGERASELIYFKVYKSQIPVIEQAVDTAALMLGTDKSRGYCLEMICADFLAGAQLNGNPKILLLSMLRLFRFLPTAQKQEFLQQVTEAA